MADLAPDEFFSEHAYLVARGVRPLALVGHCDAARLEMLRQTTRLERLGCEGAIPFIVDRGDGVADYGYAASAWIIDLYRWITNNDAVPPVQQHRIVGMLLGYSATAVRDHEELGSGRPESLSSAWPSAAAS